jgi:hypothetical protein
MTRITKATKPKFYEHPFSALDADLFKLATRLWGAAGLAAAVFFDNLEDLDYDPENVRPGSKLKLRNLSAVGGNYTVRVREGCLSDPTASVYAMYENAETIYDAAERALGSRYLYMLLARANGLDEPYLLRVGQVLKVPALLSGGRLALAAEIARNRKGNIE